MNSRTWRVAAAVGVLAVLVYVFIALTPPYAANLRFQRYLDALVETPQTPEIMQAAVVNHAAQLGLPVRAGDVRVSRAGKGVRVEIIYVVRVDFPLYTVDLHFHPSATT